MSIVLLAAEGWDPAPWITKLQAELPEHRLRWSDESSAIRPDGDADEVAYLLAWRPRAELFDRLPNLRAIFSLGAGVDHIMRVPNLPDLPIARIIDPDLTARMTGYVVWQVLHHHRQGRAYARFQAEHRWNELPQPAASAVNVGIMGLGVLGTDAAGVLRLLGFNVAGWSRTPKQLQGVDCFHGAEGLTPFLNRTDILVSLLPLTPETRGIIDRDLIAQLRRDGPLGGPYLINAGRGGSQVAADILEALRNGTLAGASLDVFETEPLPPDDPLWDAPNLVITPHAAAASTAAALSQQIAEQIKSFERGEPLRNLVEPERGY